jgi:hypothetical protein
MNICGYTLSGVIQGICGTLIVIAGLLIGFSLIAANNPVVSGVTITGVGLTILMFVKTEHDKAELRRQIP